MTPTKDNRTTLECRCSCGAHVKATGPREFLEVFADDFRHRHRGIKCTESEVKIEGDEQ